jgi:hypothetical protein
MNNKNLIIGIASIVLIGGAYFFYTKSKKKSTPSVVAVKEKLTWISNPELSSYLTSKLDAKQLGDLAGWLDLIRDERSKDSTKYAISKEFSSPEISDVAAALYQMKVLDGGMADYLKTIK